MRTPPKSRLLAYRQCPKRLWLEVHRPRLREDSAVSRASFAVRHQVGYIARRLLDLAGSTLIRNTADEVLEHIEQQLLTYCAFDTYAMARLW